MTASHPPRVARRHRATWLPRAPIIATAPPAVWRAWLMQVLVSAWDRITGAALLLVCTLAGGAAALWIFGEVADEVTEGETEAFDVAVHDFLAQQRTPPLDDFFWLFSFLGAEVVGVLLLVLLLVFGAQRRWGAAFGLLIVTGGAQLLNNVLKDHFQRVRPAPAPLIGLIDIEAQVWSFPSGHAMVSAAFYLFVAYLSWRLFRGWLRALWTTTLVVLVLLIGLSRLYLGVHYLTDVIAGYAAGTAWTASVITASAMLRPRRRHATIGPTAPAPAAPNPAAATRQE